MIHHNVHILLFQFQLQYRLSELLLLYLLHKLYILCNVRLHLLWKLNIDLLHNYEFVRLQYDYNQFFDIHTSVFLHHFLILNHDLKLLQKRMFQFLLIHMNMIYYIVLHFHNLLLKLSSLHELLLDYIHDNELYLYLQF